MSNEDSQRSWSSSLQRIESNTRAQPLSRCCCSEQFSRAHPPGRRTRRRRGRSHADDRLRAARPAETPRCSSECGAAVGDRVRIIRVARQPVRRSISLRRILEHRAAACPSVRCGANTTVSIRGCVRACACNCRNGTSASRRSPAASAKRTTSAIPKASSMRCRRGSSAASKTKACSSVSVIRVPSAPATTSMRASACASTCRSIRTRARATRSCARSPSTTCFARARRCSGRTRKASARRRVSIIDRALSDRFLLRWNNRRQVHRGDGRRGMVPQLTLFQRLNDRTGSRGSTDRGETDNEVRSRAHAARSSCAGSSRRNGCSSSCAAAWWPRRKTHRAPRSEPEVGIALEMKFGDWPRWRRRDPGTS